MTKMLQGKHALVTGRSRGIGRAIAERLAEDGTRVVVNYRENADAADEVAAGRGGKAVAVRADISKLRDIEKPIPRCLSRLHSRSPNTASGRRSR